MTGQVWYILWRKINQGRGIQRTRAGSGERGSILSGVIREHFTEQAKAVRSPEGGKAAAATCVHRGRGHGTRAQQAQSAERERSVAPSVGEAGKGRCGRDPMERNGERPCRSDTGLCCSRTRSLWIARRGDVAAAATCSPPPLGKHGSGRVELGYVSGVRVHPPPGILPPGKYGRQPQQPRQVWPGKNVGLGLHLPQITKPSRSLIARTSHKKCRHDARVRIFWLGEKPKLTTVLKANLKRGN